MAWRMDGWMDGVQRENSMVGGVIWSQSRGDMHGGVTFLTLGVSHRTYRRRQKVDIV